MTEMPNAPTSDQRPVTVLTPSITDPLEIYYEPSKVFERRRGGQFWWPLLVLVVVFSLASFAAQEPMRPFTDAAFERTLAKSPNPDRLRQNREVVERFAVVILPVAMFVGSFFLGGVLWVVARVTGSRQSYSQAMTVVTFAGFVGFVAAIVNALQAAFMPGIDPTWTAHLSIGPARFLDPATAPLATDVLEHLSLFALWSTFLIYLGVKTMARVEASKAWTTAAVYWGLGLVPSLVRAMFAS